MGAARGDGGSSSGGPQRSELAAKTRQQKAKTKPVGQLERSVKYGRQSLQPRVQASIYISMHLWLMEAVKIGLKIKFKFTKIYTLVRAEKILI